MKGGWLILEYQLLAPLNEGYSVIEQVLTNRGVRLDDIYHYLNTTDEDSYPPEYVANIEQAAKMLIKHLNNSKEKALEKRWLHEIIKRIFNRD